MSKFFAVRNLTEQSAAPCVPWEFQPTETLTEKIRKDKTARQDFYRNIATRHNFYSGVEPANPNLRTSKDNPPKFIHAFVADYDLPIPEVRLVETIAAMKIKPAWRERSLAGNVRLVWLLPAPLPVETFDFAAYILQQAEQWLSLELLPGLDSGAFNDPARLFCNGCNWLSLGDNCVADYALQSFLVSCGKEYRFKGADNAVEIPLDAIEAALREKYPDTFNWPGMFETNAQGPSFWVPGSTSPLSAILKPEGFFTFSDHAEKPFYTWADLLGPEFVSTFGQQAITKATQDVYWDGKNFHRKINGGYCSLSKDEMSIYLEVECGLKPRTIKTALSHIHNHGRVSGAAPFIFKPQGRIEFQGRPVLNTYHHRAMQPAEEVTEWGEAGKFPFLSRFFENLFDPHAQLDWFLAWWKHLYTSAVNLAPMPGQNVYLMGGAAVGKTLCAREMIGKSVGGYADASGFLVKGGAFNSHLFEVPIWCIDDDVVGESAQHQERFFAIWKKMAANQTFEYTKKFEVSTTVSWMGRSICTTNLDYVSSRMLGPMDNTSQDKTSIFRCASKSKIVFPSRYELHATIESELPHLLRYLLNWSPPEHIGRDVRYGYASYHEPSLLDQSHQSSKVAPFKELLIETLTDYFALNPEETEWVGTVTKLVRVIGATNANDFVLRSLRLEAVNRYLEQIQREGLLPCTVETGDLKTRIWRFYRIVPNAPEPPKIELPPSPAVNIFAK